MLAQVRLSLAGSQPSLRYQITAADGARPAVEWLGTSPRSADELLADARVRRGQRDRATAFLLQFLAAGPRTVRDIREAAQKAGLSARTIQRAKKSLGIDCRRTFQDNRPVSYWFLGRQGLSTDPLDAADEVRRLLNELQSQFPPPNPLEKADFEDDPG